MILMEAFGRGLVVEPYFATAILGGGLLRRAAEPALAASLVPQITAGTLKLSFGHIERHSRYDLANVTTSARKDGSGFVLNGAKSVVLHGDVADKILVSARLSGAQMDRGGIGLFIIDANAPGLSRRGYPTQDGLRAAEVTLTNVRATALSGDALPLIEHAVDEAIAALCSEAVGTMQAMNDLTLEYLKTRKQFGRPIGSFPGAAASRPSTCWWRSSRRAARMAMFAAVMAERGKSRAERRRAAIAAAKVQIGRSGRLDPGRRRSSCTAGIGMTMEYSVGHYFKADDDDRSSLYGDADQHLAEPRAPWRGCSARQGEAPEDSSVNVMPAPRYVMPGLVPGTYVVYRTVRKWRLCAG